MENLFRGGFCCIMKVFDLDLAQTLECGQCFNFERIDNGPDGPQEYVVCAMGRALHVRQVSGGPSCTPGSGSGSELEFLNASADDIENIWIPYFDLDRDYSEIKRAVACADSRLEPITEKYYGIRILRQDLCETLVSFIISQNKNIPQIKKCVKAICRQAGPCLGVIAGKEYYGFPSLEVLAQMDEQDFRDLKCGFRAPYIVDAIKHMAGGLNAQELSSLSYDAARERLISIRGVGDKVANCVLLFSLGFREAFPVDVWIKRIMQELYFNGEETPKAVIEEKGRSLFGAFGGYAQQYLFMYAREK